MTVDPAMIKRAAAERAAINLGADPLLTLRLVIWPSEMVMAAQARMATRSGWSGGRLFRRKVESWLRLWK